MARNVVRTLKSALTKQRELHKQQFDQLRSESLIENNRFRIKQIVKSIPKDPKCKDPLEYNPDMKHFTGSINGQKLEEPMKEKDLYSHLVGKGVTDKDATELIVRLKAPYDNKEKIDKLLQTAQKFGHMAKKQSESRKRQNGKFVPLTDKQKERQEKYHKLKKQHEDTAKKLGHDPKHPLWSNPTDPLDSIRKAPSKPEKPKLESIMEALSGSDIVQRYASKGQSWGKATNKPRAIGGSRPPKFTPAPKTSTSATPKTAGPSAFQSTAKPEKVASPPARPKKKPGTFRTLAAAISGYAITRSFSNAAGPIGGIIGAHLSRAVAKRIMK